MAEGGKVTEVQIARLADDVAKAAAPIFQVEGWELGGKVPDARALAQEVADLARSARDDRHDLIATGRFMVVRDVEEGGGEEITVALVLGSSSRWSDK